MYEVIKTIRGRQYRYLQRSMRIDGKVRTQSVYLGPVDRSSRKAADEKYREVLRDNVFKYGTSRPGARYADEARAREQYHRDLGFKGADDAVAPRTDEEIALADRWAHIIERARTEARFAEYERTHRPVQDTARERYMNLKEQVEADVHKDARQTAQDAPERTEAAPAKDFTVDDEIEARQANFDKAADEYNVGTEVARDSAAPDDMPSFGPDDAAEPSASGQDGPSGPGDGAGAAS